MEKKKNKKYDIFYFEHIIIWLDNETGKTGICADDMDLFIHLCNKRNWETANKKEGAALCTYIENWIFKNCEYHIIEEK